MSLKFNIDAAAIAAQFKEFAIEVEQDIKKAIGNLAAITHAKVVQEANAELHSSRQDYMEALGFEEIVDGVWVISLDEKAMWIEEGIEANKDMKPDLLANNAKTSKDGHKYKVIPFDYGKAPSQNSTSTQTIVNEIKQGLKKENIPFKKIERNADGSPKIGKLHSLDLGGKIPGKGNTPAGKGVSIYQTLTKTGNVRRDILTYRTVSSGPGSAGKWHHPGLEPKLFLDKAVEWAMKEWEEKVLPEVLKKWE